ncbi:hypothetical protein F5Y11DRAFT_141912 [Daldinia sp. FL1419]|nr:hypothetical protein F5Y11DRAFT_141912 [Daldinia sp. FL1419]
MGTCMMGSPEEQVRRIKREFPGPITNEPNVANIKLLLCEEWCINDIDIVLISKDSHAYRYLITKPKQNEFTQIVIHVMLPVVPYFKTQAIVSTIEWVQRYTTLPVPKVLIYDPTGTTQIGFEWIVLEYFRGQELPVAECGEVKWDAVSSEKKRSLVRQLVAFYSATFDHSLPSTGSLCMGRATGAEEDDKIGVMISPEFYTQGGRERLVHGPFQHSDEWIQARIEMKQMDCITNPNACIALRAKRILSRLKRLRELFFSSLHKEATKLANCAIGPENIIMNHNRLVGVVGWEQTYALPLWKACELPKLLQGITRTKEPDMKDYLDADDNWLLGAKDDFSKHVRQWERTLLQEKFLDEMFHKNPSWMAIYKNPLTRMKKDYDIALSSCDNVACQDAIEKWLHTVEVGVENIRLQKNSKGIDISILGFIIRSLEDRIFDSENLSDTARGHASGPESRM